MRNKILSAVLIVLLGLSSVLYAGELEINVDKAVAKMTKEVNLTAEQIESVKGIFTDYFTKQQEIMEDEQMTRSEAVQKEQLTALKAETDEKFAHVLTPEQMGKLHQKDQMRQLLNKDKVDFQDYLWDSSSGGGMYQF